MRLTAIASLLSAALVGFVAVAPAQAGVWTWLAIAAVTTVFTPLQARVGMSFPRHLAGRALTSYNLVLFVATFAIQIGLGVVMDWLSGGGMAPQDAFRAGLGTIAALQAIAWLVFVFFPWRKIPSRPAVP